ncbi:transposase [Spirosoma arboris]|nr:transposase [Spirosoma arboris]
MSKIRRSFTPEDRYSIVQEAIRDGHAETCRKYNLSPSLLRKWRLKYLSKGKEGLKDSYARVDPQLRALEEENERLKRIVAKQALEIEPRWRTTQKRTAKKNAYSTSEKLALMKQFESRVNRTLLCQWLDLPRSVYYYQPQSGIPGARPSQVTTKLDGQIVDNQLVVNSIRQLLDVEFNTLGYEYITYELKKEYLINKKKAAAARCIG